MRANYTFSIFIETDNGYRKFLTMLSTKNLNNVEKLQSKDEEQNDVFADLRYVSKSGSLITESLQRGGDVMQLANGDIIVSEMKPVTFYYAWDKAKGRLVRLNNTKLRRN